MRPIHTATLKLYPRADKSHIAPTAEKGIASSTIADFVMDFVLSQRRTTIRSKVSGIASESFCRVC